MTGFGGLQGQRKLPSRKSEHTQKYYASFKYVPCEFRAPEDFPKRRYNLLDMSAMRVAHYGLDSWLFSLVDNTRGTRVEQVVSSFHKILRGSQLTYKI